MSGLEAVVLVPLLYGVGLLAKKVNDQRDVIAAQVDAIRVKNAIIEEMKNTATPTEPGQNGAPGGQSPMQKVLVYGGVVMASGFVAYNAAKLMLRAPPPPARRPSPNYQPTASYGEADQCVVCLEYQRDTVLEPCHHFALCWPCAEHLLLADPNTKKCPVCREVISDAQFMFVA